MSDAPALTRDDVYRGALVVAQPKKGYRFAIDPLLLVDFVLAGRKRSLGDVVDFGTGSGVISLCVARRDERARITAVELQSRLADIADKNIEENGLSARVKVVRGDLCDTKKKILKGGLFDWVLSNPPFRPLGEGDSNEVEEAAIARHEIRMTLDRWCQEARRVLRPDGRVAIIYPSERVGRLLQVLEAEKLRPMRMRVIHPRAGTPATRVLVEAHKGKKGNLVIEAPWYVLGTDGKYSDETEGALVPQLP